QPEKIDVPRVSDGVVFRVLSNLLILDGERLSYRTLDVEQIGSVYEAIMGFNLEVAQGRRSPSNLRNLMALRPRSILKSFWLPRRRTARNGFGIERTRHSRGRRWQSFRLQRASTIFSMLRSKGC